MASQERERLAHEYGFASYTKLIDASQLLLPIPPDTSPKYFTKHPYGYWFLWREPGPETEQE